MREPEFTAEDSPKQAPERRRYTRRSVPAGIPPYFETFERIAVALESIASLLEPRSVTLPDSQPRRPGRAPASSQS